VSPEPIWTSTVDDGAIKFPVTTINSFSYRSMLTSGGDSNICLDVFSLPLPAKTSLISYMLSAERASIDNRRNSSGGSRGAQAPVEEIVLRFRSSVVKSGELKRDPQTIGDRRPFEVVSFKSLENL